MEKTTLFCALILFAVIQSTAQTNYNFVTSTETYSELTNAQRLNYAEPDEFEILLYNEFQISNPFNGFGTQMDPTTIMFSRMGRIRLLEPDWQTGNYYNPYHDDLVFGTTSSVWIDKTSNAGNMIKLEWRNMQFGYRPANEKISFQLWINRSNHEISFHYGKSSYTKDSISGIIYVARAITTDDYTHSKFVDGTDYSTVSTYKPIEYSKLSTITWGKNFPPEGTVITFKPISTGLLDINSQKQLSVYPNPTNGNVYIDATLAGKEVQIYNAQGQCLKHDHVDTKGSISLEDMINGIYLVKIENSYVKINKTN